ncbi:MAG: hypothetical protein ACK5S5_17090, partial [Planctomycetota bacterium]
RREARGRLLLNLGCFPRASSLAAACWAAILPQQATRGIQASKSGEQHDANTKEAQPTWHARPTEANKADRHCCQAARPRQP